MNTSLPPRVQLKLRGSDTGFDLLIKQGDTVATLASVHHTAGVTAAQTEAFAKTLSAAFLMVHALDDLVEHAQPDLWDEGDPEEAAMWRAVLRAHCLAAGSPIPPYLLDPQLN